MSTPFQTYTPTLAPTQPPTNPPLPDIDNSQIIYVCEGVSCDKCGNTDMSNFQIQLTKYSLLDELLSRNYEEALFIQICGSTRENHPSINISRILERTVEIQGEVEQQYLTFMNVTHYSEDELEIEAAIEIKVENVTIIVDESNNDKKNMYLYFAELHNSPIEVENLTLLDGDTDLFSLSAVRNSLFAISTKIIDDSISKIKLGKNYITFFADNKDSHEITVTFHEYDLPLDLWATVIRSTLKFTVDQNLLDTGTQSNLVVDIQNNADEKATISFDNTWNNFKKVDFILIKHYCSLDILSEDKEVANVIKVSGDGAVTRNGKIDRDDDSGSGDDGNDGSGGSGDTDGSDKDKDPEEKKGISILTGCLIVIALALVAYGIYIIYKKKCKRRTGSHDYNQYLTNADDLGNIDDPL